MVSSAYVKKAMIALLSVLLLCCLLASPAQAWTSSLQSSSSLASSVSSRGNSFANRRWTSMMFNFGGSKPSTNVKKSLPITIKVRNEKKDFTVAEGSSSGGVNLRKVLLENKVDVYPLQAKILGKSHSTTLLLHCSIVDCKLNSNR